LYYVEIQLIKSLGVTTTTAVTTGNNEIKQNKIKIKEETVFYSGSVGQVGL